MGLRLGKHPLLPPPQISDTYGNDLIIFHMIYISTISYDGMPSPIFWPGEAEFCV